MKIVSNPTGGVANSYLLSPFQNPTQTGTAGNDQLFGTQADDIISELITYVLQ
jgi:hypothetical protein